MKVVVAALVLMMSLMASAQNKVISIDALDLSYTGGLLIKHDNAKGSDRDETNFRFNLNYAQNLEQYVGLMWKAKAYINRSDVEMGSADTLNSSFGAAGGALYNFQPDSIKDSYMASALVGLERSTIEQSGADDKSGFNLFLELEGGKRFDLGQYSIANISYAPTVAWNWKRYGGDIRDEYFKSGYELRINFLKFDILF
jgi:hypothetical protein